jgi:energy-coupling factor transporter transmembrane protein EcfT
MAMALEARGFQRRGTRTSYLRYRWRRKDTLCTLAAMGFAVLWILW